MPSIVIKYKSAKTLQALQDFAKYFDFVIEGDSKKETLKKGKSNLPINFAENPDIHALAGIWKESSISLEDIRDKAWGNRI